MSAERIIVKCYDCGSDVSISKNTFNSNKNKDHKYRCKKCYSIYRSEISKNIWKNMDPEKIKDVYSRAASTRKNKSDDEKKMIRDKVKATWDNKSDEEMKQYKADCAIRTTKFWSELTDDQRKEISEKDAIAQRQYIDNMSDDEYQVYIKSQSNKANKLWDENRDLLISKMSDGTKKQWERFSDNERKNIADKISKGRQAYWDNLSDEERIKFGIKHKQWWNSLSDEEKEKRFMPMRIGFYNWYNNLSDEEKKEMSKNTSKKSKEYWNNMTPEEKELWQTKRLEGFNKYFNSLNAKPNKNEESFIHYLEIKNINYKYQYHNKTKHSDFDKLFPNNPVTESKIVSPYHAWDFILHLKNGDVLVDIDGSIHDISNNYKVTSYNGKVIYIKDIIQFNDSKRPYQTDGLPSYVILCYNDNLSYDTIVQNIITNENMSFKEFIALISFMNMNDKEIKDIIN